jgi:hypothetical protein
MATGNVMSELSCCGAQEHPWETFSVATKWMPDTLHCLIVGESPGEVAAKYFYNVDRKVAVRTIMLRELHRHGMLQQPSLAAFRDAGFLFDHAIRCLLPARVIQREAGLSNRYESLRASSATHLASFLRRESPVWVMGRIARNAVAAVRCEFPRDVSDISKPPHPRRVPEAQRYFVSRYLLHASRGQVQEIFARLHPLIDEKAAAQCAVCVKTI